MECCSARDRSSHVHARPKRFSRPSKSSAVDSHHEIWRDALNHGGTHLEGQSHLDTPRDILANGCAQEVLTKGSLSTPQSGRSALNLDEWAEQLETKLLESVQGIARNSFQALTDMQSANQIFKERMTTLQEQVDRMEKLGQSSTEKEDKAVSPVSPRRLPLVKELHKRLHEELQGSVQAADSLFEQLRDMDGQQKDTTLDLIMAVTLLKDTTLRKGIGQLIHEMDKEHVNCENDQLQNQDRSQTGYRKDIKSSGASGPQSPKKEASSGSVGEPRVSFDEITVEQLNGELSNLSGLSCDKELADRLPLPRSHSGMSSVSSASTDVVGSTSSIPSVLGNLEDAQEQQEELAQGVKLAKLRKSLEKTERMYEDAESSRHGNVQRSVSEFVLSMDNRKKDTAIDCVMGVIILLNSLVIGVSLDHDVPAVAIVDILFTLCFIAELGAKFYLHGVTGHFSSAANIFDFCLVAIDIVQLCLDLMNIGLLEGAPSASMFRVVRLVRLVRLLRLIRLQALEDLVAMIVGILGGVTTLMWAMVLFFLVMYITSLLFREMFGNDSYLIPYSDGEDMAEYFNTVPRSMFTVFRFFFGDFTTVSGMSLLESLTLAHGTFYGVLVSILYFAILIGLFNVIAAIFVESTLAAANETAVSRKNERMNNEILWMTRITLLVRKLYEHNGENVPEHMSAHLEQVKDQQIPEEHFSNFMKDRSVIKALTDLEIDPADHKYLFDILDNDNTGSITVCQLSDGVERLRGDPRRSDIICIDLMLRSIQEQTNFLTAAAKANVKTSSGNKKVIQRMEHMLEKLTAFQRETTVEL